MRVTLSDPIVQVDGWTPDLDRLGSYTLRIRKTPEEVQAERQLKADRGGGRRPRVNPVRHELRSCLSRDPSDSSRVFFLPGLWPRIKGYLDSRRIAYELVDRRDSRIRPQMDMAALSGETLREKQDVALALVGLADCGIIDAATGFGKSYLIKLICKVYPTLNIVITTSSVQVVGTLCEYLRSQLPGCVGQLGGGKDTAAGKRIVVCTLKSLPNISPDRVDLVLVDECHNVGDNQAGHELMKFGFARRFGFSASPVRNDGSALFMESLLGPVILRIGYQDAVDLGAVTPMKYAMLDCCQCPGAARRPGLPDFLSKRFSYWVNGSRNRVIADFVRQLKQGYGGQILIMVSTLEHAIRLHVMLPWFVVAYYGNVSEVELRQKFPRDAFPGLDLSRYSMKPRDLERIRMAFAKGTLRYCISTKVFRQGVNFTHLSCLIRADGDTSSVEGIQIPGRLSRLDNNKDYAYLVDVSDQFSDWAFRRSSAREQLYREQGWERVTCQELIDDLSKRTAGDRPGDTGRPDGE